MSFFNKGDLVCLNQEAIKSSNLSNTAKKSLLLLGEKVLRIARLSDDEEEAVYFVEHDSLELGTPLYYSELNRFKNDWDI